MREAFLKRLFSKVNCGVCGQKYDVSNIKILDQEDGLWVLSVYCSSCGTQGLIAAVVQEGNITEVIPTSLKLSASGLMIVRWWGWTMFWKCTTS